MSDERLRTKGRNVSTAALLLQAGVSERLADRHLPALGEVGYTAERRRALHDAAAEVLRLVGLIEAAHDARLRHLESEDEAIRAFKRFRDTLRLALPVVVREGACPDLEVRAFDAGGTLGRSPTKLLSYAVKIAPHVARLEQPLAPFFRGESPSAHLEALRQRLAGANDPQAFAASEPPATTAELHRAKGVLLEAIEDLNRYARIRFASEPAVASTFDKKLLARARRKRKAADPTAESEPTPEAG